MAEEKAEEKIEEKSDFMKKMQENPWMVSTIVLGLIAIILLFAMFKGGISGNVVSEKNIGDAAVSFINTQLLGGEGSVTLNSVEKESGLYKVTVNYNGNKVPTYFTLDGKNYVYGQLIPTADNNSSKSSTSTQAKEIPKTSKPVVDLYVMSFCPYGNKAEDTLEPVYKLLKDKVDWNIHFIVRTSGTSVSSLHGQPEVDQDEREACVLKNNGIASWFKFATYVNSNCGSDGSCWRQAASSSGLDANAISNCAVNNGLSLMQAEEAASNAAGASGSPTMIINGVKTSSVYQYGNSQAYLDAVCSAFTTAPAECSQKLEGTSTTATTSAASCG